MKFALRLSLILAATASVAFAGPGLADQAERDVPPGAFVYMRDVGPRPAEGPNVPGRPSYVVLGGKAEVFDALGLDPMSDAEQAAVSATPAPNGNLITNTLNRSLESLHSSDAAGQASLAGESQSLIGGTVGRAMSSLHSALGSMRRALGADR